MDKRYTELELATAIEDMLEMLWAHMDDKDFDDLCERHPVVEEVQQFGPTGPCGLGLGYFGGHAVGE